MTIIQHHSPLPEFARRRLECLPVEHAWTYHAIDPYQNHCPRCGAQPGRRCVSTSSRSPGPLVIVHAERRHNRNPKEDIPMNYVEQSALQQMPVAYRAVHGLLATGAECLRRAEGIAKERSLDPAVIAEISASMALASAARAMVIAIHQSRRTTE